MQDRLHIIGMRGFMLLVCGSTTGKPSMLGPIRHRLRFHVPRTLPSLLPRKHETIHAARPVCFRSLLFCRCPS
jgi:hypothetical protein